MNSLIQDQITICRAAIATTIAARLGMPFASPDIAKTGDTEGRTYFTICSKPPAGPVGYPMETELLPLEAIMRNAEMIVRSEESLEDRGMTAADHTLEQINAFVHDQLLNPSLPLSPATPSITTVRPVNRIYGETLKRATFAGSVVSSSERYKEAEALLFEDGARSKVYKTYIDYEERIRKERNKLADVLDDSEQRKRIEQRIAQLNAEWIGLGRKNEIEEAFRIFQEESSSAGFEDERQTLIERLKAGEKVRIDADGQLSYAKVQLVPITPLFSEESGTQWQRVKLKTDDIRHNIDNDVRDLLGVSVEQIERATEKLRHLSFEFFVCSIRRDWLDTTFFKQRYWRLDSEEEPISDGKGGGQIPALPKNIIFIRDAEAVFEGETVADFGDEAKQSASEQVMMRTMQVLPDRDDEPGEQEPELIEAAKNAGLSSSLNLLNRETKRAISRPQRRVMAISHDDYDDKSSANRERGRSSTNSVANIPKIRAVAAERTGDSDEPRQLNSDANIIRPSTAIRTTARSRSSSREARSRISARSRSSRDSSSDNRIQDRTRRDTHSSSGRETRSRSSPSSRSSRDPRTPDRRNRERHEVKARRGRPAEQNRTSVRRLNIIGEITTNEKHSRILDEVSLSFVSIDGNEKQNQINLNRTSNTRLTFDNNTRWRSRDVHRFEFILKDGEGDELDRRITDLDDDESTLELKWNLTAEPVLVELAGKHTPTLHGYGIEVVPPSPNPDEELDWY
ncbi:MAG: hypothetical protein JJU13_17890 [Balneolaceae bacterium]|nr:hypothetical protein [Balneolaceae bacterium]